MGLTGHRPEQAGSRPESVVDGEPGDPGPAGHRADAEGGNAAGRDQVASRGKDRRTGAIDPSLPLTEIVAAVHDGSLTDCMLTGWE